MSGVFILVFTFPQTLWAILSGFYVSKTNRYKNVIVSYLLAEFHHELKLQLVGSGLWAVGLGIQILFDAGSHIGFVLGILQLQSIGIGFSLQTSQSSLNILYYQS
jgi:hypothetical protein